jgi:hypothetical protein
MSAKPGDTRIKQRDSDSGIVRGRVIVYHIFATNLLKTLPPRGKAKKMAVEDGAARVIADDVKQRLSRRQQRFREPRAGNFQFKRAVLIL